MDKKISELNVATALTGTEELPIVQDGETKKVTAKAISELGGAVSIGQVAFGTAAGVIGGDAGLFWDNVNKRLGVGTTSPTARLHVQASGALSTDIAFRVRNSADTGDLLSVNGLGVLNAAGDAIFNGVNVGRGGGNILSNTRVGTLSLVSITTGTNNLAYGLESLRFNLVGNNNCAFGVQALRNNLNTNNSAFGNLSFYRVNNGSENVAFGSNSGSLTSLDADLTAVSNSVFIGFNTKANANTQTNQIVIGHNAIGAGSNTVTLGNTLIIKTILRGTLNAANLPTSATGLVAGDIWNDAGTLKIV
jgi:hypothetical protein